MPKVSDKDIHERYADSHPIIVDNFTDAASVISWRNTVVELRVSKTGRLFLAIGLYDYRDEPIVTRSTGWVWNHIYLRPDQFDRALQFLINSSRRARNETHRR